MGLPPQPIITCHGFAILSSKVIRSLGTDLMLPRGLSCADLLAISPYEFSWYTLYLQANRTIDMHQRESLFRCVHTPQQYTLLSLSGVTGEDMSRGYIGLTINSKFSRDLGLAELGAPMEEVLGRYVSFRTLGRAVLVRVGLAVRIVLERLVSRGR